VVAQVKPLAVAAGGDAEDGDQRAAHAHAVPEASDKAGQRKGAQRQAVEVHVCRL
jgi:hypothetical protein